MSEDKAPAFDGWGIVELMGHVKMAGRVTEEQHFGVTMGRCDSMDADGNITTIWFGGQSIYRLTPCDEETARIVATQNHYEPVSAWDITRLRLPDARAAELAEFLPIPDLEELSGDDERHEEDGDEDEYEEYEAYAPDARGSE